MSPDVKLHVSLDPNDSADVETPIPEGLLSSAQSARVTAELVAHHQRLSAVKTGVPMGMPKYPMRDVLSAWTFLHLIKGIARETLVEIASFVFRVTCLLKSWSIMGGDDDLPFFS